MRIVALSLAALFGAAAPGWSQFFSNDAYTEYSMLEPGSGKFRIVYYVTERTTGSRFHVNPVRPGSVESDVQVFDPATGQPLKFDDLTGAELIAQKTPGRFDPKEKYLRVHLPRPVPDNGEVRVRIDKTYYDPKAYYVDGGQVVFKRTRGGISSNSMVLPKGYTLVSSNVAAQVIPLQDGRLKIAFANSNDYTADVVIRARRAASPVASHLNVEEWGFFNTETLYELQEPASHMIHVTHDFTEYQPGAKSRLRIFGEEPIEQEKAVLLDTGTPLKIEKQGLAASALLPEPVREGTSARIRVTGIVRDPGYRTEGDGEIVWDRTFSTIRNTVLLPSGWDVVAVTAPGVVSTYRDGRIMLHWVNTRTDPMRVAIRARRP